MSSDRPRRFWSSIKLASELNGGRLNLLAKILAVMLREGVPGVVGRWRVLSKASARQLDVDRQRLELPREVLAIPRIEPEPPLNNLSEVVVAESDPVNAPVEASFDAEYYVRQNPDLNFGSISPFEHYMSIGWKEGRDPASWFSSVQYLEQNPDVQEFGINPFVHFLTQGFREQRRIGTTLSDVTVSRPAADGVWEWSDYEAVRARTHSFVESSEVDLSALEFCQSLRGKDLRRAAQSIVLPSVTKKRPVDVTIVIPCWNEVIYTLECLSSIAKAVITSKLVVEVIAFDNGSVDETESLLRGLKNLVYIRVEKNIGFGPANNQAVDSANGTYLLFLNNDAQLAAGTVEHLVEVISGGAEIGAVGPKLLGFDGRLQEAGCFIDEHGGGHLIGFGKDHRLPRYNYLREVEYVSGAALMMRRDIFLDLGGFDPVYAPAYCEDSDLCFKLRKKGLKIVYVPEAVVAHHLSVTSNKGEAGNAKMHLATRNQQRFVERWQSTLTQSANSTRLIAFYLPQYHPVPENDRWWGKGFTEWTNLTQARPNYAGHRQPRQPSDLGYYDLRSVEVMEAQAKLAKRYGVQGFCYYYYWFDGKRLLERPLENMLASGKPDMPFCLCWANENWTRTWDGEATNVLMAQDYCEENDLKVITDLARYMKDPRYIRIAGKPLLLIYRIKEFPNFARTARVWRNYCEANGVGEIVLAVVESFDLSSRPENPAVYGCDISVEFPPHEMVNDEPAIVPKTNREYVGNVHDYRNLVYSYAKRAEPGFARLRTVLAGWDNTPRRQNGSLVLEHATPGAFQAWLEWTLQRTREQNYGDERIVFINAWNEWCEGSYLEPDTDYGHAYLQAVRNAVSSSI